MNQHWVPQFYLRYFAVPGFRVSREAQIWVTDFQSGEMRKTRIREVAAAEYLYSHLKEDGVRCYRIEDKLARLESTTARFYPRVVHGFPELEQDRGIKKLMSLFLATMMLRHPEMADETSRIHNALIDLYETVPKDTHGCPQITHLIHKGKQFPFDNSDYNKYKASDDNDLKKMFADQVESSTIAIAEELIKKRWIFFCAAVPIFLTSDKPIVMWHAHRQIYGVRTPGVNLFFPISPTRMLWMTDQPEIKSDGFFALPTNQTTHLNLFAMANATAFLLSHECPAARLNELHVLLDKIEQGSW